MSKDTGGSAFPYRDVHTDGRVFFDEGMTLRDYFAARVLNGVMSCEQAHRDLSKGNITPLDIAAGAYAMADAMLEARK